MFEGCVDFLPSRGVGWGAASNSFVVPESCWPVVVVGWECELSDSTLSHTPVVCLATLEAGGLSGGRGSLENKFLVCSRGGAREGSFSRGTCQCAARR